MKKVSYLTARKIFDEGGKVAFLPNKIRLDNVWVKPLWVSYETELSFVLYHRFDLIVAAFRYHNCNREVGLGVHYYVED